jgi:hypothetical protein
MTLWIISIVVLVVLWFWARDVSRAITTAVWKSTELLGEKLDQLTASMAGLKAEVSSAAISATLLGNKVNDQLGTIQRLLKPTAYVAEVQVQSMQAEQIAEVSRSVDQTTESVDQIKVALLRREIEEARNAEDWKKRDAEIQARLRQEKRLLKIQRRTEQSGEGTDEESKA